MESNGCTVITGENNIRAFQLISIYAAFGLELKGLQTTRTSAYQWVKKKFGFTGGRKKVFALYEAVLLENGVITRESGLYRLNHRDDIPI